MIKLIYHTNNNSKVEISPFDIAITDIVENQYVKIACPYISIEYLKQIIRLAKDWKLISDIDEWLKLNSLKDRAEIKNFISEHNEKIHHCRDLHAKVLISDEKIFVGSSNFTKKGLTERNEVSVVIDNKDEVIELNEWFEEWWNATGQATIEDVNRLIESLPSRESEVDNIVRLPSKNKKIHTVFAFKPNVNVDIESVDSDAAIKKINKEALQKIRRELAEKYIDDSFQKDIFLSKANKFTQWANYIAALILTKDGKNEFTPSDIRGKLKEILGDLYNKPGAKVSGFLTADVEINSNHHKKYPSLEKTDKGYKFVGFPVKQ
jgi:hypothetical protein